MDMRDLVTGGAACAVPGSSSSSSNPLAALANTLIGSSSKIQVFFLFFSSFIDLFIYFYKNSNFCLFINRKIRRFLHP